MNQRKGGKQYVCGAGIVIISLIAFYAVLSGTENKRILQVKNEIYTFEMTEEEAAKAVLITYIQIVTMIMTQRLFLLCSREKWYIYTKRRKK